MKRFELNIGHLAIPIVLLAWLAGMFIDVMEIDAGQYASMSLEMLKSGDYLHLVDRGVDYLDKPPLIFWLTTLSFKTFGVSTFAYKLPSVLMAILAVWSLGRLGTFLYDRRTGDYAALIMASCQAVFLMNNDVKTDMYMIGPMVFALWQLVVFARGGRWWHLQLGFLGLAVAVLGKGPIGVVAPGLAMGADFLIRRDWKGLFRRPWLLGLPIFALALLPFCIGLYEQYGREGVEFFLWTQSFGRITGESEWQNDASPFFFVHTFLWSFLPWCLVMIPALLSQAVRIVRNGIRLPSTEEAISISGFILLFLALSSSRFKLPHYIFVTYPFAALLCAAYLNRLIEGPGQERWQKAIAWHNFVVIVIAVIACGLLGFWAFPGIAWYWKALLFAGMAGLIYSFFHFRTRSPQHQGFRMVVFLAAGFSLANFFMNAAVYPALLNYQASGKAGMYIHEQQLPLEKVYAYLDGGRALDFYAGKVTTPLDHPSEVGVSLKPPVFVYTNAKGLETLRETNRNIEILREFDYFRVAALQIRFINPATRPEAISQRYLVRMD